MRYVEARIEQERREEAYRIYVTRSLQFIPQNKYMSATYEEIVNYKHEEHDTRSGDEIALDFMKKNGLTFKKE